MDEQAGNRQRAQAPGPPRRVDPLMMMTVGLGAFFLAVLAVLALVG